MEGTKEAPGVNYSALKELFKQQKERTAATITLEVALLDIYCEEIRDLLNTGPPKKLEVKQSGAGNYVPELVIQPVSTYDEVLATMQAAQKTRAVASTNMNQHSSRSHFMLQVFVSSVDKRTKKTTKSKLSMVDLA